jgi:hypothetical protein
LQLISDLFETTHTHPSAPVAPLIICESRLVDNDGNAVFFPVPKL